MRDPFVAVRFLDGEEVLEEKIPVKESGSVHCRPITGVHDELVGICVEKTELDSYTDFDGEPVEEWVTTCVGTRRFIEEERTLFCKECHILF